MSNEQLREMLAEMERAAEVLRRAKQRNAAAPCRQQLTAMKPIGEVVVTVIKQIDEMERNSHGTR